MLKTVIKNVWSPSGVADLVHENQHWLSNNHITIFLCLSNKKLRNTAWSQHNALYSFNRSSVQLLFWNPSNIALKYYLLNWSWKNLFYISLRETYTEFTNLEYCRHVYGKCCHHLHSNFQINLSWTRRLERLFFVCVLKWRELMQWSQIKIKRTSTQSSSSPNTYYTVHK